MSAGDLPSHTNPCPISPHSISVQWWQYVGLWNVFFIKKCPLPCSSWPHWNMLFSPTTLSSILLSARLSLFRRRLTCLVATSSRVQHPNENRIHNCWKGTRETYRRNWYQTKPPNTLQVRHTVCVLLPFAESLLYGNEGEWSETRLGPHSAEKSDDARLQSLEDR